MIAVDIEKLNQLISRTDISGNDKVRWLTDFIDCRELEQAKEMENEQQGYSEEEVLGILVKAMKDVKVKRLTFFDGGSEYPIYSNLSKWFEKLLCFRWIVNSKWTRLSNLFYNDLYKIYC